MRDETFDPANRAAYNLYLLASPARLCLAVADVERRKFVVLEDYQLPTGGVSALAVQHDFLGLRGWIAAKRRKSGKSSVSARGVRRLALQAGVLGCLWGLLPILAIDGASLQLRMLIVAVIAGMIGCGGFAMLTVPAPSALLLVVAVTDPVTMLSPLKLLLPLSVRLPALILLIEPAPLITPLPSVRG